MHGLVLTISEHAATLDDDDEQLELELELELELDELDEQLEELMLKSHFFLQPRPIVKKFSVLSVEASQMCVFFFSLSRSVVQRNFFFRWRTQNAAKGVGTRRRQGCRTSARF
jgi:hypothetical protein